jgi:hypothetical protein
MDRVDREADRKYTNIGRIGRPMDRADIERQAGNIHTLV